MLVGGVEPVVGAEAEGRSFSGQRLGQSQKKEISENGAVLVDGVDDVNTPVDKEGEHVFFVVVETSASKWRPFETAGNTKGVFNPKRI